MAANDQVTAGAHYFQIKLGGAEAAGFFKEIDGIGSENEVITHTTTDAAGQVDGAEVSRSAEVEQHHAQARRRQQQRALAVAPAGDQRPDLGRSERR